MRIRSRGYPSVSKSIASWYSEGYDSTGKKISTSAVSYYDGPYKGEYEVMHDVLTPNFRELRNQGKFTFNPMVSERYSQFIVGGSLRSEAWSNTTPSYRTYLYYWLGDHFSRVISMLPTCDMTTGLFNPHRIASSKNVEDLISEAATEARARVRAGDMQGYESLATWRQTYEMLRNPFNGVANLTRRFLRNLQGKRSRGMVKDVASEYLKYRYGLLPLISDIQAILKALEGIDPEEQVYSSRASVKATYSAQVDTPITYQGVHTSVIRAQTSHEVKVRALSVDAFRKSVLSELGFMPDQIPMTAYNLIPLSFVLDWFVNVGSYVNAITPRPGVEHMGGCVTVEEGIQTTLNPISTTATSGVRILAPLTGSCTLGYTKKARTAILPPAKLVIKGDFKFDQDTRVADAVALAYQRMVQAVRSVPRR